MSSPPKNRVTPELLALIVDLLPAAESLRDICAITGLHLNAVRREAAPFLAIMKLTGTHPQCGCGRDRFHPYGCAANIAKNIKTLSERAPTERERAWLTRRDQIIEMLIAGHRMIDIDNIVGTYKSARKYLRFMTEAQLAQREQAQLAQSSTAKKKTKGKKPKSVPYRAEPTRPFSDGLYARIATAVPRWLSPALRDDVISDMYVAVSSGTMLADEIEQSARKFASTAANQFQNKYGHRSLDEKLFDDGGTTLGDTIVDHEAFSVFAALDDMPLNRRRREAWA